MPKFPSSAGHTERFQWPVPGRRLGGVNLRDDPVRVPFHQFTVIKNCYTREGAPARRMGYGAFLAAALASQVKSFAFMQKADDTTRWLAFAGTTAYSLTGDPGAGVATDTTAGFTTTNRKRARQYNDILYAVEGAGGVRQYDAAAWSAVAAYAAGDNDFGTVSFNTVRHIAVGFDRTWYAGSATYPQYLWPSEIGQPNYCKVGMVVKIDSQDGQDITGLLEWGAYILVPKERSIWAVPNKSPADSSFRQIRITAAVGCPSGDTLQGWDKYAFFLGSDARVHVVYLGGFADDLKVRSISGLIQPALDALTAAERASAEALVMNDYYILAAGGKWYVLDLPASDLRSDEGAVWHVYEHASPQTALFLHPTKGELYSAGTAGQVRVHGSSVSANGLRTTYDDDAGTPIDWKWETGWFHSGAEERQNLFTQLVGQVKATPGSQVLKLEVDTDAQAGLKTYVVDCKGAGFVLGQSLLGSTKLGLSNFTSPINQTPPSIGRRWRFRGYRSTDTKQTKVYSVVLYFRRLSAF